MTLSVNSALLYNVLCEVCETADQCWRTFSPSQDRTTQIHKEIFTVTL